MRERERESLAEKLPSLSELELQFLLAYVGIEPKSPHPIEPHMAYLRVRPGVTLHTAYRSGRSMLRRIQRKGGLGLILDQMGLTVVRAAEVLRDCTYADTIRKVYFAGGAWDYVTAPDHRTRLRAARTILELQDGFRQTEMYDDGKLTFAEAVLMLTERQERSRLLGEGEIGDDADFEELDD